MSENHRPQGGGFFLTHTVYVSSVCLSLVQQQCMYEGEEIYSKSTISISY